MSSFNSAFITKKTGRQEWEVVDGFDYHVGSLASTWVIRVPAGFRTDGASVPRLFWFLWPPFGGDYDQAAALHDYLYRTQFKFLERVVCDAIFVEAMKALNTSARARWCIFVGVRAFGWLTYRKYRLADDALGVKKEGTDEVGLR
jgi:hypothetical protein